MKLSRLPGLGGLASFIASVWRWKRVLGVRICGAPLYVRWTVLVVLSLPAWFVYESAVLHFGHWLLVAACYLTIIVVHELGHAFMAHRLGYEVVAVRIGAIHGACEFEAPDDEWHDVLIHWAGVLAQLAIAIPCLIVYELSRGERIPYVTLISALLGRVNLFIALFNLLPFRGFDGHIAWRIVFLWRDQLASRRVTRQVMRKLSRSRSRWKSRSPRPSARAGPSR